MPWLKQTAQGDCLLTLRIQPGAKRTGLAGLYGGALKIRLAAPPVDGKANSELIAFIAQQMGIPKSRVWIKSGDGSRSKVLVIEGVHSETVRQWASVA